LVNKQTYECWQPAGGVLWLASLWILLSLFVIPSGETAAAQSLSGGEVKLSKSDLGNNNQTIYITDRWKFNAGDSLKWARKSYNDSGWETISTQLGPSELPFINWRGIGWFRLHIKVDSTLAGEPLAMILTKHNGASEIYLDGKKIYTLGTVSSREKDYQGYTDLKPRTITFPDTTIHVLAVRYANFQAEKFNRMGFTAGFRLYLGNINRQVSSTLSYIKSSSFQQMLFTGALVAFTLIHLMLFIFYPAEKNNLYFALFTGMLALLSFSEFETVFTHSPILSVSFARMEIVTWLLAIIFALRFTYSLFYQKAPIQFWILAVIGLVLVGLTWYAPYVTQGYREIFAVITIVEIFRVLMLSFIRKREGVWIIGTGLGCFVLGIGYSVFANLEWLSGSAFDGNFFGSGLLILAMSVYLSRNFAQTNNRLQHKLNEVQELSRKTLEQERINREKEVERKLLAAENERKSKELEEARALQLSMLPRKIPETDFWDISVFMDTANEVGGDYYDFSISKDGMLTVALGDATGHGMKAGIMVATAKSYFHTLADEHGNLEILKRMSFGIRNMDLRMLYMGLMLVKCRERKLNIATAGMPPALWYRSDKNCIERITLKGLPLGTKVDFPYKEKDIRVSEGDALLLMSDGLMELFNAEREMLGVDRIERTFQHFADHSTADIMTQITKLAEQWSRRTDQEDDVTIMVLKAKKNSA